MSRRFKRAPVLILAAGVAACATMSDTETIEAETWIPAVSTAPPNIVLVLFEDLSPRIGAFGDALAVTPNFDKIAAEGVRYTNVFTTSGVCAPSRAALITGRYQHTIGAQHMRTTNAAGLATGGPQPYLAVPAPGVKAFPETLRAAGYHTSNDSKTDYQFGEPFTIWDISEEGADWSTRKADQPFFHMRTFFNTHESTIWPKDMTPRNPVEAFIVNRNQTVFATRQVTVTPDEVDVPPYLPDVDEVRRDLARHYDNIAFTDAQLGDLYDRLEAEGLLNDTILIVSTDHGDGLPRMKRSLYDSGLHVPMVIRYPDGWGAGSVNDEMISFIDLAPTILSWAGLEVADGLHGADFSGADRTPPRDYIFAAQDRMDSEMSRRRAVRDERFKYIRNFQPGDPYFEPLAFRDSQPSMKALWAGLADGSLPPEAARLFEPLPKEQFYDTREDPHEVRNLAEDKGYAGELERLRSQLDAWLETYGDMSVDPETEMINQMWPDGVQPVTKSVQAEMQMQDGAYEITLVSATEGASIGYRFADRENGWQLYNGPLRVSNGTTLEVKAIRYGYAESLVETVNVPE
ncbi:MAG: sulfatase [Pseudomonadota bacterium]